MSVPKPISASHVGKIHWNFYGKNGGVSKGKFTSLNIAEHVGDDLADVEQNRELISDTLDIPLVFINATHSANVVQVLSEVPKVHENTDALVTRETGLGIVVMSADCAPIILADPIAHVVGVVHAGWQGMLAGVVNSAVEAMLELGAETQNMTATIGPSVCAKNFEVTQERFDKVLNLIPSAAIKLNNGNLAVDITKGIKKQLASFQIKTLDLGICTFENSDVFSYRRDKETGRNATVAWIS
jgi:polyphenol oxidase